MESHTPSQQQLTKVTLIRHAQSRLNQASQKYRTEHNLSYIWAEICKNEGFLKNVKYNSDFLDCDITEKGVEQCNNARKTIKDQNIKPDIILVSPLLRALRTCSLVFADHTDIPVKVEPLLSEGLRSLCDIATSTEHKQKAFPQYDFSATISEGQFWFLKNQSEENQKKYFEMLQQYKEKTFQEKLNAIKSFMESTMIYQHPSNIRARTLKIKKMIQQKYSKKYKNIAFVAHYNIVNFMVCTKFNTDDEPEDYICVQNCQIIQRTLEEMLKYM